MAENCHVYQEYRLKKLLLSLGNISFKILTSEFLCIWNVNRVRLDNSNWIQCVGVLTFDSPTSIDCLLVKLTLPSDENFEPLDETKLDSSINIFLSLK